MRIYQTINMTIGNSKQQTATNQTAKDFHTQRHRCRRHRPPTSVFRRILASETSEFCRVMDGAPRVFVRSRVILRLKLRKPVEVVEIVCTKKNAGKGNTSLLHGCPNLWGCFNDPRRHGYTGHTLVLLVLFST